MFKFRCNTHTTSWPQSLGPFSSPSRLFSAILIAFDILKRLGSVGIYDAIGLYSKIQLKVSTGSQGLGACSFYPSPSIIYSNIVKLFERKGCQK